MEENVIAQTNQDISIVLCGQAGQGIQTVEYLLTRIFKLAGYNVFATKEYMSRVRGGTNSTQLRVSSEPVRASVERIDILVALDRGSVRHVEKRISTSTVILAKKIIHMRPAKIKLAAHRDSMVKDQVLSNGTQEADYPYCSLLHRKKERLFQCLSNPSQEAHSFGTVYDPMVI